MYSCSRIFIFIVLMTLPARRPSGLERTYAYDAEKTIVFNKNNKSTS